MRGIKAFVGWSLFLSLSACTGVISYRSDQDAWNDFQKMRSTTRSPASASPSQSLEALQQIPFRDFLMKCGVLDSPETCYQDALVRRFDEIFRAAQVQNPKWGAIEYRKSQSEFLAKYSYEHLFVEVTRFHQSILSGVELSARDHARELLAECEHDQPSNPFIERFDLFSGGVTEVPKGVYACLGSRWDADINRLLDQSLERLGLKLQGEFVRPWILKRQIAPIYESELSEVFTRRAQREQDEYEAQRPRLLKDFDFSASDEVLLKKWSPILRERFPHSKVEQWILSYKREGKAK